MRGIIPLAFAALLLCACSHEEVAPDPVLEVPCTIIRSTDKATLSDLAADAVYTETVLADEAEALSATLKLLFSGRSVSTCRLYDIEYPSLDRDGRPITLSARVCIPETAFSNPSSVKGLALVNHHTLSSNDCCPTLRHTPTEAVAWLGYIAVVPDFYGFGASADRPQAYLDGLFAARGNLDAMLAARDLLGKLGLSCPERTVNLGYSQGGTIAIANLLYASQHPEYKVVFDKTFAGGGIYDLTCTYDRYLAEDWLSPSYYIVLAVVTVIEYEGINIKPENAYREPLLSKYRDVILSKKCRMFEIRDSLERKSYRELLSDRLLDPQSLETIAMRTAMDRYNLVDRTYSLPDRSCVYLLHSADDNFIPVSNYDLLKQTLQRDVPSGRLHFYRPSGLNHIQGYASFLVTVAGNLD